MPTSTDLVTDLPADFEVFGQAVDTSMADLKGGTSGQILSKASNTDMDFTWITNDIGDITAVTVSSPLTGGGTSGSVSVGILNGTTSNLGAVQLSDSTSSTSTTLAATANAVKTSYDLAAAAVPKSTVTTAGDVIYATGSSAVTRLGIGTAGQVLTVNSGATAPEWGTPSVSGLTLIATASPSATATVDIDNCFSSTYQSYQIHYNISGSAAAEVKMRLRTGGVTATTGYTTQFLAATSTTVSAGRDTVVQAFVTPAIRSTGRTYAIAYISNPFATAETSYFTLGQDPASNATLENRCGNNTNATSYDGLSFFVSSGNFTGSIRIYGVKN